MSEGPRRAWQRPVLRDDGDARRPVGWIELFFDLVFVVVVAILTAGLERDPTLVGGVQFLLQFIAIFWVWNGFTYYTERFESDGIEARLFTLVAVLSAAGLAVWGEGGLGPAYAGFAISYLVARGFNIVLWLRAAYHEPRFRPAAASFAAGYLVGGAVIALAAIAPPGLRTGLFAVGVVIDIASPALGNRLQADLPPISRDKFPERFGLFTLIVLGESLAGIIRGAAELRIGEEGLAVPSALAGVLGVAIGFGLWWIYFDVIARRAPRDHFVTALGWVYLHIGALASAVIAGAGITLALDDAPDAPLPAAHRILLLGGLGATLLFFSAIELTLRRLDDDPLDRRWSAALRILVGAVLVVVGLVGGGLSPLGALACGLAALVLLVAVVAVSWFGRRMRPVDGGADPA